MADFSFEGLKATIKSRLALITSFSDTLFFSVNERLIDAFCFVLNKFSSYVEYLLRESKWSTAKNKTSVLFQSAYLNYKPDRKKGAYGFLEISTDPNFSLPWTGTSFIVPEWSFFTIDGKVIFTPNSVTYSTSDGNSKFIDIRQGQPKSFFYTATGIINEEIIINSSNVDSTYIKVYKVIDEINEVFEEITVTDNLYKITSATQLVCEINNDYEYTQVIIKFGNNLHGRALNPSERLKIIYSETLGTEGNIYKVGNVKAGFILYDSLDDPIPLYARINDAIDGGTDIETIEEIRLNAPNLFQTAYRCASNEDWDTILARHQIIGKVYTYGEYELYKDILKDKTLEQAIIDGDLTASGRVPDVDNIIHIVALTHTGDILSEQQKEEVVVNYIRGLGEGEEAKTSSTHYITWTDPEIIDLRVKTNATLEIDVDASTIISLIKSNIATTYDIMNNSFYSFLYKSVFDSFIQSISGVYEHKTNTYIRDLTFTKDSQASDKYLIIPKLQAESCHIMVKRKISDVWSEWEDALDDRGDGTFIIQNQYAITNGSLNYTNSNIKFTFLGDGLTHILNGEFSSDTNNWAINTEISPQNVRIARVYSEDELGIGSNDSSLGTEASTDAYCLRIMGNAGNTGNPDDNWINQSLTLTEGEDYEIHLLVYAPSTNIAPNGTAVRIGIGTSIGATDIVDKVFTTPGDGSENTWTKLVIPFTAGVNNYLSLFLNSVTVDDKAYYDKIVIKHIEPNVSWGVQNPSESDPDGYLIEVYYQAEEEKDIKLYKRYQILNISEDNIEVNVTFLS